MITQLINNKTGFGPKKGFANDMFLTSTFPLNKGGSNEETKRPWVLWM